MENRLATLLEKIINIRFIIRDVTVSTNSDAKSMIKDGQMPPFIVVSKRQSSGYGQNGNKWESNCEGNLYASFALNTIKINENVQIIPQIVAIEICKQLKFSIGVDSKIKWPNDIFVNSKKIGGILLEVLRKGSEICAAVLGVGINILSDPNVKNCYYESSSLKKESNCDIDFDKLAVSLIKCMYDAVNNFGDHESHKHQWEVFDMTFGSEILVRTNADEIYGTDIGIGENGELLVLNKTGSVTKISQGNAKILPK